MRRNNGSLPPAISLFFLTPVIAEFLPGYLSLDSLVTALVLAPMYGGGALLIRELTRRAGRGWWTILILGLAYGVVEEGFGTQSLFNPHYADLELLQPAHLPGLGMGAWWTVFVVALHAVWSIALPIAIVEAFTASRPRQPWLGRIGLTVTALVFALGVAVIASFTMAGDDFRATPGQFIGAAVAVVLLATLALTLGGKLDAQTLAERAAPPVWLVTALSLLAGAAFAGSAFLVSSGGADQLGWPLVLGYLVLVALMVTIVRHWSVSPDWGDAHRLALAGGALLTYAANAFIETPSTPVDPALDLAGNLGFALGAVVLLLLATRRVSNTALRPQRVGQ
ncbi:hypothetical protein [Stackebrandtia nassauensis]|uniref:DUF998 domain-containing protein n=1 Tax=Stackebrandtia nassauensis (strain DSM 44728 / CIP 108903 / NRRL B-16338 / NBRC 102104 / LLR-40K-21) TaxID=446470 RepID=D3Q2Y3_STANL|nr:hypothetical protein [Stackebrandtia nassauensis]ADD39953.1 hypothetical protein Snas_0234 [Stackebrandtia nassauensis DSM 44728]